MEFHRAATFQESLEEWSVTLKKRRAKNEENGSAAPTLGNARLPGLPFANNWLINCCRWTAAAKGKMEAPRFGGNRKVPMKNLENP
eukprot:8680495-Pyramimonas_sp.AAC.1